MTRVFYISLVFSNARHVLSQCNTRLRLLYLLHNGLPWGSASFDTMRLGTARRVIMFVHDRSALRLEIQILFHIQIPLRNIHWLRYIYEGILCRVAPSSTTLVQRKTITAWFSLTHGEEHLIAVFKTPRRLVREVS